MLACFSLLIVSRDGPVARIEAQLAKLVAEVVVDDIDELTRVAIVEQKCLYANNTNTRFQSSGITCILG